VLPAPELPERPELLGRRERPGRPEPASERLVLPPRAQAPVLLRHWTLQPVSARAVLRPASLLMVYLPGHCRRAGLRRLRPEHLYWGMTDEVDGPRGPLRSTTLI
jgi:hypothetical protein